MIRWFDLLPAFSGLRRKAIKVEFRFAISPTPAFYSTVRLAALSLRALGAPYDQARILVSVGDYASLDAVRAANKWADEFPLDWWMVPHDQFRERSYIATGHERMVAPTDADVVILCDADVCLVDRIDDLLTDLARAKRPAVAGMMAHHGPFGRNPAIAEQRWRDLFFDTGLGEPRLDARYSNDAQGVEGRAPAYFNYGLIALNREAFHVIAPIYDTYVRKAAALTAKPFFQTQLGMSLAIAAARVDARLLPHTYNCANDDAPFEAAEDVRLRSADEIRVIHYLRDVEFDRRTFLCDPAAYDAFMKAPALNRVNTRLRDHIASLGRRHEILFR